MESRPVQAPLTAAQLDFFRLNGFLHIPGLVPAAELAPAQRVTAEMIARGLDTQLDDPSYRYGRDALDGDRLCLFRIDLLLRKHKLDCCRQLLAYPPLLAAISQAVNGDYFASQVHSVVFKVPHRGYPVPWHQDPVPYFHFPVFNVDIYLDEANPGNGGLYVLPGSHLAGYHGTPDFIKSYTGGKQEDAPGAVPVYAKPGDVLFHSTSLIHGSFWNRSNQMRRTIYFHINHLQDVLLRPPTDGHRTSYLEAQQLTAEAVAWRAAQFPQETPFPYRQVPPEALA